MGFTLNRRREGEARAWACSGARTDLPTATMGHASADRGTPAVHVAGWDPVAPNRPWTSSYNVISEQSSRIRPSSQRMRDGRFQPNRGDSPMLNVAPHMKEFRGMSKVAGHPNILRDGSPRQRAEQPAFYSVRGEGEYVTSNQSAFASRPFTSTGLVRPDRHAGAMPWRVSPHIWETVYMRDGRLPAGDPNALPAGGVVETRGDATVPTRGDWAEPGAKLPATQSPRLMQVDNHFAVELLEAKRRSEQRRHAAALALAADREMQPNSRRATPQYSPRFALSPRG